MLALLGGSEARDHAGRDLLARDAESADPALYMATLLGSSTPRYGLVTRQGRYVRSHLVQPQGAPGSDQLVEQLWTLAGDEIASDSAARASTLETLARRLDEKRASLRAPRAEQLQPLSPRDREMLRQLGYGE